MQSNHSLSCPPSWPTVIKRNDVREKSIYSLIYSHHCTLSNAIALHIQGTFLKQFRSPQKREEMFLALLMKHLSTEEEGVTLGHNRLNTKLSVLFTDLHSTHHPFSEQPFPRSRKVLLSTLDSHPPRSTLAAKCSPEEIRFLTMGCRARVNRR